MTPAPVPTRSRSALRGPSGFTLVEAIATITIISIIALASARILLVSTNGYAAAATRAELINTGSAAMERIAVAIQDIPLRSGVTPAEPWIDTVAASSITWSTNSSLSLSGSQLLLTIGGVSSVLAENVTAFSVQTFDQSNSALSTSLSGDACDAVRRVQVTLTLGRSGASETLRCRFFLRCMITGASA